MPDSEEQNADQSLPSPDRPGWLWTGLDRLLRGPPNCSIQIYTSSSPKPNWAARDAHSFLFQFGQKNGTLSPYRRFVITLDCSDPQLEAYKTLCTYSDEQKSTYIARLSREDLIQVTWVPATIHDEAVLRLILGRIERFISPFIRWPMRHPSPFLARPPVFASDLAKAIELAMLIDLIRADWLRPVILEWLARLSAVIDITQTLRLPGRGRSDTVSLPPSFLEHLSGERFQWPSLAANLACRRIQMLTQLPVPPNACTDVARCGKRRTAFFAQLCSEPVLLGLEPLNDELVARVGRCEACKRDMIANDNDWSMLYHQSFLQAFGLDNSYNELLAARDRFYEAL
ncbi:hypothetical protein K523DRAFT_420085 [Schizophyllum commune Tattone D]|nr:hypothetical protein K523DRAFT_420085 [Schizophyllum commune Tattone D]